MNFDVHVFLIHVYVTYINISSQLHEHSSSAIIE